MSEFVRIYNGHDAESSIIGFSIGVWGAPQDVRFGRFMAERGYRWRWVNQRPTASVSQDHIEVRPPLQTEHMREFGALLLGSTESEPTREGILSPTAENVFVADNRLVLPEHCFDTSNVVRAQTPATLMSAAR